MWPDFTRITLRIALNEIDGVPFRSYEEMREEFDIAIDSIADLVTDIGYMDMVFQFNDVESLEESKTILDKLNIKYVTDVHIGEY